MKHKKAFPLAMASLLLLCSAAAAQNVISAKAGVISYIHGTAYLDNTLLIPTKDSFFQMGNDQRLKTLQGFAEVVLTPESYLRIGDNSCVRMQQNRITDIQLSVESGAALIEVIEKVKTDPIKVQFQTGYIEIRHAGLYRFDSASREFSVYGGEALVMMAGDSVNLKGGKKIRMNGDLKPAKLDEKAKDALHQWAARRSFDLFNENSDTGKQTNWIPIGLGWLFSMEYHISYQSPKYYVEYMQGQSNPAPYILIPNMAYSDSSPKSSHK
jgi:hypothetical protein